MGVLLRLARLLDTVGDRRPAIRGAHSLLGFYVGGGVILMAAAAAAVFP